MHSTPTSLTHNPSTSITLVDVLDKATLGTSLPRTAILSVNSIPPLTPTLVFPDQPFRIEIATRLPLRGEGEHQDHRSYFIKKLWGRYYFTKQPTGLKARETISPVVRELITELGPRRTLSEWGRGRYPGGGEGEDDDDDPSPPLGFMEVVLPTAAAGATVSIKTDKREEWYPAQVRIWNYHAALWFMGFLGYVTRCDTVEVAVAGSMRCLVPGGAGAGTATRKPWPLKAHPNVYLLSQLPLWQAGITWSLDPRPRGGGGDRVILDAGFDRGEFILSTVQLAAVMKELPITMTSRANMLAAGMAPSSDLIFGALGAAGLAAATETTFQPSLNTLLTQPGSGVKRPAAVAAAGDGADTVSTLSSPEPKRRKVVLPAAPPPPVVRSGFFRRPPSQTLHAFFENRSGK